MDNPLISIIVPVYNAEKILHECVDSLLSQTYPNLEIMLVDDGSSDRSYAICTDYAEKDQRVKAFTKPNGGQASARNYALDRVTGDYISFVDDDDRCDPEMYEHLVTLIEKYHADITGTKEYTGEKGRHSGECKVYSMPEFARLLLPDEIGSHVLAQVFKKELFENIRFPYSKSVEDMRLFTLLIERVTSVVKSEWELYHYSVHENNTSFRYAQTPASSLDRAEAFSERYALVQKICPEKLPVVVRKTVTFGLGGLGMITSENKQTYEAQINKILSFFRIHGDEIRSNRELNFFRKFCVRSAEKNVFFPMRWAHSCKKLLKKRL